MAQAINTKLGRHTMHDREVKRSKVDVPAGMGLHVNMTA